MGAALGIAATLAALGIAATLAPAAAADTLPFTVAAARETQLGSSAAVPPIPPRFVGASIDYCGVTQYMGARGADTVLGQLLGAIAAGRPLLRIGGNGPEAPCPGVARHPASTAIQAITSLLANLPAKLILGIDLAAHRVAKARREVTELLRATDPRPPYRHLSGFEIGNEPDRYPRYGAALPSRRASPLFPRYLMDFVRWAQTVRQAARNPTAPIAGPALGRLGLPWITGRRAPNFLKFAQSPAHPKILTFHAYPLSGVGVPCPDPRCPSIPNLLLDSSSRGLAAALAQFPAKAPRGRMLRVDELNSITGGGTVGISDTFSSALWALDTTFEMAHAGFQGVNFHTFSTAGYALFSRTSSRGWTVHPDYYGLLMFARAAPAGSRLLAVNPDQVRPGRPNVKVWATHGVDGRTRVLIINRDYRAHDVVLSGDGLPTSAAASLQLLRAAPIGGGSNCPRGYVSTGLCALGEVTLGGRSFGQILVPLPSGDQTSTGTLAGPTSVCEAPLPSDCKATLRSAGTRLTVPEASALLLGT